MIVVPCDRGHGRGHAHRAAPRRRRSRTRPSGRSTPPSWRRPAPRCRRPASSDRCRAPCGRRWPRRPPAALRTARPASSFGATTWSTGSSSGRSRALRALDDVARRVELVVLDERLAHRLVHRLEERVGHGAADDQAVDARDQVLDHLDLVRDLGAAQDGHEGPLGLAVAPGRGTSAPAPSGGRRPARRRQLDQRFHRRVRAVRGAEGVVDVDVASARPACWRTPGRSSLPRRGSAGSRAAPRRRLGRVVRPRVPPASPTQSAAKMTGRVEQLAERASPRAPGSCRRWACPWDGRGARPERRACAPRRARSGWWATTRGCACRR